jgi:hypothetical protein
VRPSNDPQTEGIGRAVSLADIGIPRGDLIAFSAPRDAARPGALITGGSRPAIVNSELSGESGEPTQTYGLYVDGPVAQFAVENTNFSAHVVEGREIPAESPRCGGGDLPTSAWTGSLHASGAQAQTSGPRSLRASVCRSGLQPLPVRNLAGLVRCHVDFAHNKHPV